MMIVALVLTILFTLGYISLAMYETCRFKIQQEEDQLRRNKILLKYWDEL